MTAMVANAPAVEAPIQDDACMRRVVTRFP